MFNSFLGSVIAPSELKGVSEVIRPPFFSVANAVGAAMAKVSGDIDTIEILRGRSIDQVIEQLKKQAIHKALEAGADESMCSPLSAYTRQLCP